MLMIERGSHRYYWKVVVDESANEGVAFVGLNNPHSTDSVSAVRKKIWYHT